MLVEFLDEDPGALEQAPRRLGQRLALAGNLIGLALPVPVRSRFSTPSESTHSIKSRYWRIGFPGPTQKVQIYDEELTAA